MKAKNKLINARVTTEFKNLFMEQLKADSISQSDFFTSCILAYLRIGLTEYELIYEYYTKERATQFDPLAEHETIRATMQPKIYDKLKEQLKADKITISYFLISNALRYLKVKPEGYKINS